MANVLHPHIDFHPRPVAHAPSPFGFGFGLGPTASPSMSSGWGSSTPGHTNPAAFYQLASSVTQSASYSRPQKRRLDPEDDTESGRYPVVRDESMDRSPTPERPKRTAPKRARVLNSIEPSAKDDSEAKENRAPGSTGDDDVDIGVLLASLPPQSLLPLLSSLLKAQPSLKSTILPLIPRPTLDTAIQALALSAKRLREAYPYSNSPTLPQPAFGLARISQHSAFGQSSQTTLHPNQSGMRDSYIISRLRPHVNDFVSSCISYLPYFTCIPSSFQVSSTIASTSQSHLATTIQSLHKDKFHPSETFHFLSAVTNHLINQPPLTLSQLSPLILPRLSEEWKMWVDKVDELVNRQAGMFGSETVRGWERGLDDMTEAKVLDVSDVMRSVRDTWVLKVGWLVGRTMQQPMDEL
ncbi:hypothetical protein B0H34DRAFT_50590 [Crassisporium funariophilum]|nr:hypothetical protein B0H34DRAFT_50590 [Crassisporium funariophilum]